MRNMTRKKAHDAMRHAERMRNDLDYRLQKILNAVRHRCQDRKQPYYFGLPVEITLDELRELWFRDGADLQEKPSIDRIKNSKGYTFDNCRFIPFAENVRRALAFRDEEKKVASLKATVALRPNRFCVNHPDRKASRKALCGSCYGAKWQRQL